MNYDLLINRACYDGFYFALQVFRAMGNTVNEDAVFEFLVNLRTQQPLPLTIVGSDPDEESDYRKLHPEAEELEVQSYMKNVQRTREHIHQESMVMAARVLDHRSFEKQL